MNPFSARFRPWFILAALLASSLVWAADSEPGKIEASEPRVQIRAEILKATPLGSSPEDVLKFIAGHFKPRPGTPSPKLENHPAAGPTARASNKKGAQSIRLILGRYVANPGLFFMEIPVIAKTTTAVQWAFDKEGKLIEVFVDKDAELGDEKGPDD